jgi:hypothetical protein
MREWGKERRDEGIKIREERTSGSSNLVSELL